MKSNIICALLAAPISFSSRKMVFCRVPTAATRNEFRKAQNRLRSNHSNSICAFAEFCQRFTPGGKVLYVGDADEK